MKKRRSLFGRLALVLLLVLTLVGTLYLVVTITTNRIHDQEVRQSLHRDLAANLVKEAQLMDAGEVQQEALYDVFHTMMVVNPAIEVYLLDPSGEILSFSAPLGVVQRERVDRQPILEFLGGQSRLPLLGDDPRDPAGQKVFSAAPVGSPEDPEGYLYVVLGGQQYESVAERLKASYILRLATGTLLASLLLALGGGLLLVHYLTRRLRRLSETVATFDTVSALDEAQGDEGDEIDRLGASFERMAGRLVEQVEELQRLDGLRRELVANVSHDLRTPLTSLQGYLDTLRLKAESLSAEERGRYLDIAARQTARLSRLVDELFELAKLDSGGTRLQKEPVALAELVQDAVSDYRLVAERSGVALEAGLPRRLAYVSADTGLVARVLANLIDNALKHTPRGGRVQVEVEVKDDAVAVAVSDNGPGIAPEELPRVFERYFYGGAARHPESSGLGLAIARKALELHGTAIDVASQLGAGTTFSFQLPRAA